VTLGYRNQLLDSRSDQTEDSRANQGFLNFTTWFIPQFGVDVTSNFSRWEFQQSKDFTGIPSEDFFLYQAGLTMNYQWQPQRITYARYGILYLNYDEEHGIDNNNYMVHQPTVGLSFAIGPNTSFGASVGYWRRDINNENSEDGASLNANFSAQGEKSSLSIQTNSGYDLDIGTSQNQGFSKYSDSSVNVDYQLRENSRFFATARYRWEDFADTDRTDHTYGGRIGFAHTFRNWFTLALEGGHLRRDSNENDQEFTDNRVLLRLTAAYPIPFWD
jgi:hypothetical protein